MHSWRLASAFISMLLLSPATMAHGGESFEQKVGRYFVDIGYDIPLMQGQETLLDIALYEEHSDGTDELSDFTSVTLMLTSGSVVQFERSVRSPDFGKTFTTISPEKHGHWILSAEFFSDDALLQRASFDVMILESDAEPASHVSYAVLVAALLFSIFLLLMKKRLF